MPGEAQFEEKKQHGSQWFPLNVYPCTIPRDFPTVALHWHTSMELVYVKKGRGEVLVGSGWTAAETGDIFVILPGVLHALRGVPEERMEYENIIFDPELLGTGTADGCAQKYLIPLAAGRLPLPQRLRFGDEGYGSASACLADVEFLCGERGLGYEIGVKASLLRFLFLLLRMQADPLPAEGPDTLRLKQVLQHVESDYAQPMPIEAVAAACGCSPSHFMRWFKQMTGTSFAAYLNERRLAVAAERLRQTDDTVLCVAGEVGFENLSNFNRQFKARYGVTPREYRAGQWQGMA